MAIFGGYSAGIKPGMIVPCAGNTVQDGYLLCDGSAISRTLYPELFAAIGTTYGAGDGSTTFNLPNGTLRLLGDTVPVVGNNSSIAFSNGVALGNIISITAATNEDVLAMRGNYPNPTSVPVGTSQSSNNSSTNNKALGLTTDATKSGIIADLSATEINLLIKY